jgi:hypothetical protein
MESGIWIIIMGVKWGKKTNKKREKSMEMNKVRWRKLSYNLKMKSPIIKMPKRTKMKATKNPNMKAVIRFKT